MEAPNPVENYRVAPPPAPVIAISDPALARRTSGVFMLALIGFIGLAIVTYAGRGIALRCEKSTGECIVTQDFTAFQTHTRVPIRPELSLDAVASTSRGAVAYRLVLTSVDGSSIDVTRPEIGADLGADVSLFHAFLQSDLHEFSVERSAEPDPPALGVGPLMVVVMFLLAVYSFALREVRVSPSDRAVSLWDRRPEALWRSRFVRSIPVDDGSRVTLVEKRAGRKPSISVVLEARGGGSEEIWEGCTPTEASRAATALRAALAAATSPPRAVQPVG